MSFCLDVLLSLVEAVGSEDIRTNRQKDKILFGGKRNFYSQKGAAWLGISSKMVGECTCVLLKRSSSGYKSRKHGGSNYIERNNVPFLLHYSKSYAAFVRGWKASQPTTRTESRKLSHAASRTNTGNCLSAW